MEPKMPVRNFAGAFLGGLLGLLAFARLVPENDVSSRWILLVIGSSFGAILGFFYAEVWYGGRAIVWGSAQLVGQFFARRYAGAIALKDDVLARSRRLNAAAGPYLRSEPYVRAIRRMPQLLLALGQLLLDAILCIPKKISEVLFGTARKMVESVRIMAMMVMIPGMSAALVTALSALGLLDSDSILMPLVYIIFAVVAVLFTAILSEDLATAINPIGVFQDNDEDVMRRARDNEERAAWQDYIVRRYVQGRASFFWWLVRRFFVAFLLSVFGVTTTMALVAITGSIALAVIIALTVGTWIVVGMRKILTDYGYLPCLTVTVSVTALVAWRAQTLLESNLWLGVAALTVGCVAGMITEALRLSGVWVIRRVPALQTIEEHNRTARSTIGDWWRGNIEKYFVNTMGYLLRVLPA